MLKLSSTRWIDGFCVNVVIHNRQEWLSLHDLDALFTSINVDASSFLDSMSEEEQSKHIHIVNIHHNNFINNNNNNNKYKNNDAFISAALFLRILAPAVSVTLFQNTMADLHQQPKQKELDAKGWVDAFVRQTTAGRLNFLTELRSSLRASGDLAGIGILVMMEEDSGSFVVSSVVPNGPAAETGEIRVGDVILEIDGTSVRGKGLDEFRNLLIGDIGSKVEIKKKSGGVVSTVEVIRGFQALELNTNDIENGGEEEEEEEGDNTIQQGRDDDHHNNINFNNNINNNEDDGEGEERLRQPSRDSPATSTISNGHTTRNFYQQQQHHNREANSEIVSDISDSYSHQQLQHPRLNSYESPDEAYLKDLVKNFLVIGRETSEGTLTWLIYKLLSHPNILEDVCAEIVLVYEHGGIAMTKGGAERVGLLTKMLDETLALHSSHAGIENIPSDIDPLDSAAKLRVYLQSVMSLYYQEMPFTSPPRGVVGTGLWTGVHSPPRQVPAAPQ